MRMMIAGILFHFFIENRSRFFYNMPGVAKGGG
jgi:hypothetical protein